MRERRVRLPSPSFLLSPWSVRARTPEARRVVRQMRRSGIVKLPGFVDPVQLADMQAGLERMVATSDRKHADLQQEVRDGECPEAAKVAVRKSTYTDRDGSCYYDPDYGFYACQDAFQFSTELARFVMSDRFLSIVNSYYGKPALLARASMHRFLPAERPRGIYGWGWHQDGWGTKVNAMILLSEIGVADQHMAYKVGSHRDYRGYDDLTGGNFTDERVERTWPDYETMRCVGGPGDVFVFDGNGLHSAISTMGRKRDNVTLMTYSDATYVYGQTIPDEVLRESPRSSLRVFEETIRYNEIRKREGLATIFPRNGVNWRRSLKYVRDWLF